MSWRQIRYDTLRANHNQIVGFLTPNPLSCGFRALGEIGAAALEAMRIRGENVDKTLRQHALAPVLGLATEPPHQRP